MIVLVDTSVWSLGLRRSTQAPEPAAVELRRLITVNEAGLIGVIRQEVLSGVRDQRQFVALRDALRAFPEFPLAVSDYEQAAEFFNTCRSAGIQGAHADFLICAAAKRYGVPILTTDRDFVRYSHHLNIKLHRT